jgi:hypothetical protein
MNHTSSLNVSRRTEGEACGAPKPPMARTGLPYRALLAFAAGLTLLCGRAGGETPAVPQFPQGNLALNGSCEEAAEGGKTPLGWALMGDEKRGEVRIEERIARTGKRSVFARTIDSDTQGQWPWKQAAIYGNSDGLDGSKAFPVVPEARYVITFFARGRDVTPAEQSQLEVYLLIWTSEDGKPASRKLLRRSYSRSAIPLSAEWVEHEVDFAPVLHDKAAKRMALVFVPLFPLPPEEAPPTTDAAGDEAETPSDASVRLLFTGDAAVYIDDISITACDAWGLARQLDLATIRKGCEIPAETEWQDTAAQPPLTLWSVPGDTPIELPKNALERPRYNPLPEGWEELDLGGAWKIRKLDESTLAMQNAEDPGTTEGFFQPEFDDTRWLRRTVPSFWEGDDKLYPDGMVGFGVYRTDFLGIGWLRTRFTVPVTFKGRRLTLRFYGVDTEGTIYLNGVKLGKTGSPGVCSDFDVTAATKADGENVLAVRLYDANNLFFYDGYEWARGGGIFKDVKLLARPALYARRTLITPRLAEERLEVETWVENSSDQPVKVTPEASVEPDPGQAGLASGNAASFKANAGEHTLPPGETRLAFAVPMPKAVRWSPDNPFLYVLRLRAGADVLGKERFGYREFARDGRYFRLNGQRIYLTGGVLPGMRGLKAVVTDNRGNSYRRLLAAYREMGLRVFLSHSGVFNSDLHYELCDELGLMLYEWRGSLWPEESWVYAVHNHPSVVMFALGNEARHVEFRDVLNRAYEAIKRYDRQNRPVCSITGGAPRVVAPKTDFVDMHIYPGDINNHPLDMRDFIYGYNWDTWVYHRENLPVVSWEMGGNRIKILPDALGPIHRCIVTLPIDKKEIVRLIASATPGYQMPAEARWLALYGIRRQVEDDWEKVIAASGFDPLSPSGAGRLEQYRQRYVVKTLLEECRRLGDLFQGYGINLMAESTFGMRSAGDNPNTVAAFDLQKLCDGGALVTTDGYQDYMRCSRPRFVCADVIDRNVFAPGVLAFRIYAINDTPAESAPWKLRVVLKDSTGKRLCDRTTAIGTVPPFKRRIVPFSWEVPADLPREMYDIEMFLLDGDKAVSDNFERFFVMPRAELAAGIDAGGKKVALYDVGAEAANIGGWCTARLLEELKTPYVRLDDLDALDGYQVLIVGARSLDKKVVAAGAAIAAWVRTGGRLLQFEQLQHGALPYLPQMSVVRREGGVVADLMEIGHPAFEGIRRTENWDRWSGEMPEAWLGKVGGIYAALIGPLNQTVQATGVQNTPREARDAVAMLVSEVRMDKGLAFLSQAEATRRYGKDSVATRYLCNVLRHILSDETAYAYPLEGLHLAPVNRARCGYLDLSALASEEIGEIDPAWVKEVNAGLKGFGNLPFRWDGKSAIVLDQAVGDLTDDTVLDMAKASKLMGPDGGKAANVPDRGEGKLVTTRPESLYFLHRAEREASAEQKGMELKVAEQRGPFEEIGAYVVTYADRTEARIDIDAGNAINFRDSVRDAENAKYVGQGFYVSRWVNPHPDKPIKTIEVKIKSETARLTVLGITSTLVREKTHR